MNERIWELFKQSGIDIGEDQESNIEKFAELIVRDCAVELMKLGNSYSECEADADYMQGMLDSADIIKEHFGIVTQGMLDSTDIIKEHFGTVNND